MRLKQQAEVKLQRGLRVNARIKQESLVEAKASGGLDCFLLT
jgi:hypothetical protein